MRTPAARVASRSTRSGSWVATITALRGASSSSVASSSAEPAASSALNGSSSTTSVGLVQQHAAEPEPLPHPARERRARAGRAPPRGRSARAASRSARPAPGRGRGGRRGGGSRAASARGRRAARGRDSRSSPRSGSSDLARGRRVEPGEHAQERRLAGAVRAGDEQEPAGVDARRRPGSRTRFSPKRFDSFVAGDHGAERYLRR